MPACNKSNLLVSHTVVKLQPAAAQEVCQLCSCHMGFAAMHVGIQEATQQQDSSKTTQQLLESSRRLLKLKHETQKAVTAVRVQGDELENARRQREENMRQVGAGLRAWLGCIPVYCMDMCHNRRSLPMFSLVADGCWWHQLYVAIPGLVDAHTAPHSLLNRTCAANCFQRQRTRLQLMLRWLSGGVQSCSSTFLRTCSGPLRSSA